LGWGRSFDHCGPGGTPSRRAAAYIDRSWHEHPVPGWCIAIAQQGRIVFSKPLGVADLDNNVPAHMDTVYNMGSVSKVNTTVAVMQLC
jgi:CubicO group peptidase (beta-lactamase class C family)